jgi:hypothetical protein
MLLAIFYCDGIFGCYKALREYERAGGFAPAVAAEATDAALEEPAASTEPAADVSAPPPASESREALLPQSAEAVEAPAAVTEAGATEAVVGEVGPAQSPLAPRRFVLLTSLPLPFKSEPLLRVQ